MYAARRDAVRFITTYLVAFLVFFVFLFFFLRGEIIN